jgi:ATP-dependent Clp protease ATP-binding subunit ClpA
LFNKRVVTLDLQALLLVLNTRKFEERMKAVMNELEKMMISFFSLMKFILLLELVEQQVLMLQICLNHLARGENSMYWCNNT